MLDSTTGLLNTLKQHARPPARWLPRYPAYGGRRTTDQDKTLADWAHDLRRAFPRADGKSIETLTAICSLVAVPGGIPLIRQGEPPEAVYIVVTGQFAAYRTADTDQAEVDRFGAGDVFGDVGFFTGDAQTLTIQALRNSEVLRIAKQDLQAAAARWPGVLLAICSGAVQRLQRVQAAPMKTPRFHTFCFVPADAGIDAAPVVQKIADTLTAFGKVAIVSAEHAADRTTAWFADIEKSSDFVLLQADGGATAWTRFCLRHSDRIVLLAQGDSDPADSPGLGRAATDIPPSTPLYLMLLWQDVVVPARTTS